MTIENIERGAASPAEGPAQDMEGEFSKWAGNGGNFTRFGPPSYREKEIAVEFAKSRAEGPKPGPRCPSCQSPMEDAMKRFSANSQSAVRVFCEGKDLSHHQFEVYRLSDFWQFFTPSAGEPQPHGKETK